MELSPSGKQVLQSVGPKDAKVVLIGGSPSRRDMEAKLPFAPSNRNVLGAAAAAVGLDLSQVYRMNLVPVQSNAKDAFVHSLEDLSWGRERAMNELAYMNPKAIVAFGDEPLNALTGLKGGVQQWHGSQVKLEDLIKNIGMPEDYMRLAGGSYDRRLHRPESMHVVSTFHPAAVEQQFKWHPWLMQDLAKAKRIADGNVPTTSRRRWYFNDVEALLSLADRIERGEAGSILAFDTESSPYYIVGLAVKDEVHVVRWGSEYGRVLQRIFSSPLIKVAHNIQHDLTFLYKRLSIHVAQPWFDTMGGAHVLNNALDKNLSPAIAGRYTNWPYHKWLVNVDPELYNGIDVVVSYDAYEPQIAELRARGLYEVAEHDHKLLAPLLDMQWFGFKVDTNEQRKAAAELGADREQSIERIRESVLPIVDAKLGKFLKPKLFEISIKCPHCGGGKLQAKHCWRCGGLSEKPKKKADYCKLNPTNAKLSAGELKGLLPECSVCAGSGKVRKRLEFNPDSSDQVADVLYRGLGIRPRKYKGVETTRVGLLEPLAGDYPLVQTLVDYARLNADYDTVNRLSAGLDGRLHCVFDPFGTGSGRVASKEGLIEVGTNAMNLPKKSRRLVVPDEEMIFLYPDMKAVEGRALAVIAKDKKLIEVFNDEASDMHVLVRDDMRSVGFGAFSRGQAKRLEYASFYGARAAQLGKELTDESYRTQEGMQISTEQAQFLIDYLLSHRFNSVRAWQQGVTKQILANRRVRSITGRERIWLEYVYDKKTKDVKYEIAKQGWSFEPQDVGARVLAEGMLRHWESGFWLRHRGLIHVHDAVLFQSPKSQVEEAKSVLTKALTMEKWGMKFLVEMKTGANWAEAS